MNGHERWEFFRTIAQGLAAAFTVGKIVVETVKGLARKKAERVALVERVAALESENVVLTARIGALRTDLAREAAGREIEARAHKALASRVRAERDDGEPIDLGNVTYLRDETP